MGLTILPTKLHTPLPPSKTLDRPRLAARLAAAFRLPVTLIAADAGFGKSTLVASFLAADGRPAFWYRLEAGDSDPSVFAAYLLRGLKPFVPRGAYTSAPDLGKRLLSARRAELPPPGRAHRWTTRSRAARGG